MEVMSDPTSRVLQLLNLLQTHRFWPGNELSDRLDVSPRTLRRDVDRLRELGYLVDATPGVAGGYRLAAGNHMPPLLLDDDEAIAIAVGLRAASEAAIEGIEETSVRALAKLEQVMPDRLRRRVRALHANVVAMRWGDGGPKVDPEALALLSQACRDREQVQFEYERRDGQQSRRLVEPHQLVSAGRRWYLVAWDVRRDDWRTFRLDRLSDARLAGPRFAARELPAVDAAAFVSESMSAMPTAHRAVIEVDGPAAAVVEATQYIGGDVETVDDSRCRVTIGADSIEWMAVTIARLAIDSDVQIAEGPPELEDALTRISSRLGNA
ncbi:YafY family protein [soil metagenome]